MSPDETLAKSLSHFRAIQWCAEQLDDPRIEIIQPPGRPTDKLVEEKVWTKTLNTPETLSAFVAFYHKPAEADEPVDKVSAFVTANHGIDGWPGMMQGGIIATLMDGMAGLILGVNQELGLFPRKRFVTAFLNTTYMQAVSTPSTIMITAHMVKTEGRKVHVEVIIQNHRGSGLAKGEALFIETKANL